MNKPSFDDVKELIELFKSKHPTLSGVGQYVVTRVSTQDAEADPDELEDFCILVYLSSPLPDGTTLPTKYLGVRVFSRVISPPQLLGSPKP